VCVAHIRSGLCLYGWVVSTAGSIPSYASTSSASSPGPPNVHFALVQCMHMHASSSILLDRVNVQITLSEGLDKSKSKSWIPGMSWFSSKHKHMIGGDSALSNLHASSRPFHLHYFFNKPCLANSIFIQTWMSRRCLQLNLPYWHGNWWTTVFRGVSTRWNCQDTTS
jgi:hypothetical protein